MEYRRLGDSEFNVSVLSFGAWQIGDPEFWGTDPDVDPQAAVDAAIDVGINLFDTAEMYGSGESERILGKALGRKRGDIILASKVSSQHCAPDKLRQACEASLERLGTDVIDIYQVHWPCREVSFADTYAEMVQLKDEGKIRAIAVSNFGPLDLADWMAEGTAVSNQVGYNIIFRAVEYGVVPACIEHGVGIIAYMPLMQGLLAGRWSTVDEIPMLRRRTRHFDGSREGARHGEDGCEDLTMETLGKIRAVADALGQPMATVALAWSMAQPGVSTVLVGARKAAQVARNCAAVDLRLNEKTLEALDEATIALKQHLGENVDMWLGAAESRIR